MFSLHARVRALGIAALAVTALCAPSAWAAHRAGGGRQVCPRGTIRVLVGPHHTRHCMAAAKLGLGATRASALHSSVLRLALALRPKGTPLASVRKLANATVNDLLGAERHLAAHASTRALAAAASPAVTEIPAPPGQFGAGMQLFNSDPGAGSSTTIYHSAFAKECPAPNGHVDATAAHDEHAVRTIALPPSTPGADMHMQMRVDAEVTVKAIGHNGENGKLHDYDAVASTLIRIRLGVLGRSGLAQGSVRTAQRTSRMTFTQLVPPTRGTIASRMISATMQGSGGNWPIAPGDPHDYVLGLESMFKAFDGLDAEAFPKAQQHWYDDAGCLTINPDPAQAKLRPNQVQDVKLRVSAATGGEAGIDLSAALGHGAHGTLTPAQVHVVPASPGTLHYTAPRKIAQQTTDTITLDGTSIQGRAHREMTLQLEPDDFPVYYKVVSVQLDTHAEGHVTTAPNACTGLGYPQQSSTDAHGEVLDPRTGLGTLDELDGNGGTLTGGVNAYLTVQSDRHSTGCVFRSSGGVAACNGTTHDAQSMVHIGFQITADSRKAGYATLTWTVPPADAGVMGLRDGGDYCQTQELTGGPNPSAMTQQVSMVQLLSTGEQGYLFDGTSSWNDNGRQLGYTYNLAIYVEQVDADGNPLR